MNDLIKGLQDQPISLVLFFVGFLILPLLIAWSQLGSMGYSRRWLVLALVPIVGWLLVCVLLLLPGRPRPFDEVDAPRTVRVPWEVFGGALIILAMFAGVAWMSKNNPPPMRGFNEGVVRSTILKLVESSDRLQRFENMGSPEITRIEDLEYDRATGRRLGRVIVKHNLGTDVFRVTLTWADTRYINCQVEIELDKSEVLAPHSWQVRQLLEEELAELPAVQNLGLSADQVKALPVAETSSDPTQPLRLAEVRLPEGAGQPSQTVKFLVHWCDKAESCPGIQLIAGELPTPESVSFQHELKHAVEDWPQFRDNVETYGQPAWEHIEPLLFDAEQQQRFYRVLVRHAQGELELSAVHQWKNREQGLWEVKILEP